MTPLLFNRLLAISCCISKQEIKKTKKITQTTLNMISSIQTICCRVVFGVNPIARPLPVGNTTFFHSDPKNNKASYHAVHCKAMYFHAEYQLTTLEMIETRLSAGYSNSRWQRNQKSAASVREACDQPIMLWMPITAIPKIPLLMHQNPELRPTYADFTTPYSWQALCACSLVAESYHLRHVALPPSTPYARS